MDFYFCNNLTRPEFQGALIKLRNDRKCFKFQQLGYPYLSFDFESMSFVFKIYEHTDK